MRFLVIGHKGYLGRGLAEYLAGRGHSVLGWDKEEGIFNLDPAVLSRENVEAVVNLAVMADRQSSAFKIDEPTDVVNVQGARHLARVLKGTSIPWIQLSTREVLGPVYEARDVVKTAKGYAPRLLVGETQPWAPQNFYGKSKVMAEMISESHPFASVIRLTTCYTDYDHPGGNWVVSLTRAAVQGRPVRLTRGGLQFRDPLHVDDLGSLVERMIGRKVYGHVIHAGGGRKNLITLREFVRRVDPACKIEKAPGGDYGFAFDIRKARRLCGWEPRVLVREKIPAIAANIRGGTTGRPMEPALSRT